MSEREILLRLIASLSLCEHMGDAADDVIKALKELGYKDAEFYIDDATENWNWMKKNNLFHGTLWSDPKELEDDD